MSDRFDYDDEDYGSPTAVEREIECRDCGKYFMAWGEITPATRECPPDFMPESSVCSVCMGQGFADALCED